MDVECRLAAIRGTDMESRARLAPCAREDIALDAKTDRPEHGHDVAHPTKQGRVRQRNPAAHSSGPFRAGPDPHVGERRPVDDEAGQRDLVPEDADAVHPFARGNGDVQPADRDADRERLPQIRVVDEEDCVCSDEGAVPSRNATFSWTERDDARTVRRDAGVVAGDPEPARRVALAVWQTREEDGAAGVELLLQPGAVIPDCTTH